MTIRTALFLLPLLALAPAAHAQGSCSMPEALKARICDDPELATLDARLAASEAATIRLSPRPATWAGRARSFRAGLAVEKDGDGQPLGREELRARLEAQIASNESEALRVRRVGRPAASQAEVLGARCLGGWLRINCTVPAAGVIRGTDGTAILWQVQDGVSEEDGGGMGVMLWDGSGRGAPRLIGWTFAGYFHDLPHYQPESKLLWVSGRHSGTGEHNADLLFQKRGSRWVEIDMESWRDALDARLPDGLGAWHGVGFDFLGDAMGATTELWKGEDANCCPTGGRANLGFKIVGDALVLDTISAQIGGPESEWKDF